jgi:hypothetical protein
VKEGFCLFDIFTQLPLIFPKNKKNDYKSGMRNTNSVSLVLQRDVNYLLTLQEQQLKIAGEKIGEEKKQSIQSCQ